MRSITLALAAIGAAATASAQEMPSPPDYADGGTLSAIIENDAVADDDDGYTSGVRIGYLSPRNDLHGWGDLARRGLGWMTDADAWYVSYGLGQTIFTPEETEVAVPPPGSRPYAGFLFGSIGIHADNGDRLDSVTLDIGVVGPWSLAEEAQNLTHNIIGVDKAEGWDAQLRNEPGFRLSWDRQYRFVGDVDLGFLGLQVDAAPAFNVSLGNVDTSAAAGFVVRVGDRLDDHYGPPRIKPGISAPGFFAPSGGFGWYVFAGAEGRVVGYNMFIEGNALRDGVDGQDPNRLVGDFTTGIALQYDRFEIGYTHVFRTKEYDRGRLAQFGSLNLRFAL